MVNTVDPLGGSYFVEALTDQTEEAAMDYINRIDALGGVLACIQNGFFQREIAESAYRYQQEVDTHKRTIVGVNDYLMEEEIKVPTLYIDRVGEMAAMGVNSPAEPRAIKISWNAAPSRAGRVDAGGIVARRPRFAIVLERPANRGEGELRPRNFCPIEEPDLKALGSRLNPFFQQPCAIDQLYLADARNVVYRQQSFYFYTSSSLLPGLPLRTRTRRLIELEVTCRQSPIAVTRVD